MIRTTFVMETHLGHETYYRNLRHYVDQMPELDAAWVPVTYGDQASLWSRWPALPAAVRGFLNGRAEVQMGLRRQRGEVVFYNTQTPAAIGGRLARTRPYILSTDITPFQLDGMGDHYAHRADSGLVARWKHSVLVRLLQGAAQLLPWSTWAGASLVEDYGVEPERVQVVPPGVDLTLWHPVSRPPRNAPLRILFVGGDLERKGGRLLLDAFRQLPERSAELILVTRAPVESMPGVTVYNDLRPNSPELIALYQSADIFVLPTQAEAFGIAAVEAAAVGIPTLGTGVGGLTDIVLDGETGMLIPPQDEAALVYGLRTLLDDAELRCRLGCGARAHVEQCFDARRNAARVVRIVEEVAQAADNGAA